MLWLGVILVLAYLLGSISPSIMLSRLVKGVDIRHYGSGNAGMTNAMRLLGARWGTVVALIDLAKGFAASMLLVSWLGAGIELRYTDETLIRILAGTAAVVGHVWTIFFRFKGGKGVLTLAGAILGVAPFEIACCFAVFVIVFLAFRYVSLGSITSALFFPLLVSLERFVLAWEISPYLVAFSALAGAFIVFTHRANVGRLWRGEEKKFSFSRPPGTKDRGALHAESQVAS